MDDDIIKLLRDAQPTWLKDGYGIRGVPTKGVNDHPKKTEWPTSKIERAPIIPDFPTKAATETKSTSGSGVSTPLPFQLVDASTADGAKVTVTDGTVNGDFPTGMGFGNYTLGPLGEGTWFVCVVVTFATDTLEISSTTLTITMTPPESDISGTTGTLIILLGQVVVFSTPGSPTLSLVPSNYKVGNIDFTFVYGAFNGQPALLPVTTPGDWMVLP